MKKAQKLLAGLVLFMMVAGQVWAQQGVIGVPYRLPTVSGEEIELVIYYTTGYKAVDHYKFNITKVHPDGGVNLSLNANEAGGKINLALTVSKDNVTGAVVTESGLANGSKTLSVSSRSGEKLTFNFSGSTPTVTSDRIK